MKTQAVKFLLMSVAAGLLAAGCYTHERHVVVRQPVAYPPTGQVVVSSEPPPPRHEVVGVAPSGTHVWTPGYWAYQNNRWVWIPGHWETRPSTATTYVPGHWDRRVNGWVWTPGYWQ
jgi:hypothetical protein